VLYQIFLIILVAKYLATAVVAGCLDMLTALTGVVNYGQAVLAEIAAMVMREVPEHSSQSIHPARAVAAVVMVVLGIQELAAVAVD
jgi:ABC-type branched-subunit amino acid transport system permease subunit